MGPCLSTPKHASLTLDSMRDRDVRAPARNPLAHVFFHNSDCTLIDLTASGTHTDASLAQSFATLENRRTITSKPCLACSTPSST
jgi:hypothetical protein